MILNVTSKNVVLFIRFLYKHNKTYKDFVDFNLIRDIIMDFKTLN